MLPDVEGIGSASLPILTRHLLNSLCRRTTETGPDSAVLQKVFTLRAFLRKMLYNS